MEIWYNLDCYSKWCNLLIYRDKVPPRCEMGIRHLGYVVNLYTLQSIFRLFVTQIYEFNLNYQYDKSKILQILRRLISRGASIFGLLIQIVVYCNRYRAAYLYHCWCRLSKTYHAPFSLRCYSFHNILPLAASFLRSLSSPILRISYIRCRSSDALRFCR